MVYRLRIFEEHFTLKFKKLENTSRNGSLIENADVSNLECYWSWATPNVSAVLNNCNNEMVSVWLYHVR
jgi:plasmid rolling circle replication initiator protein Rep